MKCVRTKKVDCMIDNNVFSSFELNENIRSTFGFSIPDLMENKWDLAEVQNVGSSNGPPWLCDIRTCRWSFLQVFFFFFLHLMGSQGHTHEVRATPVQNCLAGAGCGWIHIAFQTHQVWGGTGPKSDLSEAYWYITAWTSARLRSSLPYLSFPLKMKHSTLGTMVRKPGFPLQLESGLQHWD